MTPVDPLLTTLPATRVTFAEPATAPILIEDPRLAALVSPGTLDFEPFRVLRSKVKAAVEGMSMVETVLGEQRLVRCLGVIGPTAGEGTSTIALGLANALAQEQEARVLLVEAALRAPRLAQMLGLPPEAGLSEWLAEGGHGAVPLVRLEPGGVLLLAAGTPSLLQSAELLGSEPMARLLAAARRSFDFVLLDCPPLETVADSVVLQDLLDGFLLVVRARHASRTAIRRSLSKLKPNAVHGVVFNDRTEILARWLERRRKPL
jgi:Mrp family chromosome partitioning ATPase